MSWLLFFFFLRSFCFLEPFECSRHLLCRLLAFLSLSLVVLLLFVPVREVSVTINVALRKPKEFKSVEHEINWTHNITLQLQVHLLVKEEITGIMNCEVTEPLVEDIIRNDLFV